MRWWRRIVVMGIAGLFALPAIAQAQELWRADFDFLPNDKGWDEINGFWNVVDGAYRGRSKDVGLSVSGDPGWIHYEFEGRFRADEVEPADVSLLFRVQRTGRSRDRGRYYLLENSLRDNRVRLWLIDNDRTLLADEPCELEAGVWRSFAIEIRGPYIRYWLENDLVLAYDQADEYGHGRIGVGVFAGVADFDDLIVTRETPPIEKADETDEMSEAGEAIRRAQPLAKPR
jgi:hypothetical protein